MAQLVNVIAPIFATANGIYLQTIYYPLQLFATHCHGTALDLIVESPTYKTQNHDAVPYLDASAAHGSDGTLVVNITNRHRDQPLDVIIETEDKRLDGDFQVFEVNGPYIKAENDFDKVTVKTTEQKSLNGNGRSLKYSAPAHSFSMLKGKLV
jgi:alpha-N-arabinofuranosidase